MTSRRYLKSIAGSTMLLLLVTLGPGASAERTEIVFSCWIPPELRGYQVVERLYKESFAALGYDFKMYYRPARRSIREASQGVTDGDCARVEDYLSDHSNAELVRVDALLAQSPLQIWSNTPGVQFKDLSEPFSDANYRIGFNEGNATVQRLVSKHDLTSVTEVKNTRSGLKMLSSGRLDLFMGGAEPIYQELEVLDLEQPIYLAAELMMLRGYPYMHESHRELSQDFARELNKRLPEGGLSFTPPPSILGETPHR